MPDAPAKTTEAEAPLRRDHYQPERAATPPVDQFHLRDLGRLGEFEVWTVNGEAIRAGLDVDFTAGANPARYAYVPLGELWVDAEAWPLDATANVLHEYLECMAMRDQGQDYATAHDAASNQEIAFRGQHASLRKVDLDLVAEAVGLRRQVHGLAVVIENPAGSTRRWHDKDGGEIGSTVMQHPYGYVEGFEGADDGDVDCYVGPDPSARFVYVVHQRKAPDFTAYDECKVFMHFPSTQAAEDAYHAHRKPEERDLDPGPFGGMSTIAVRDFIGKLKRRTGTGKIRASRGGRTIAMAEWDAGKYARCEKCGNPVVVNGQGRKSPHMGADRQTCPGSLDPVKPAEITAHEFATSQSTLHHDELVGEKTGMALRPGPVGMQVFCLYQGLKIVQ